ncbi:citrate synthase/methylcitrate synthase [Marininema halotolerans]|uniref:Citrate synthase n=1 Tax=Marininema halotolerans TaxID=1155944 RepID=A0A1I6RNK1_9BACL|nr:citrate synthase/methylcitrate synthase [Marininema halotolerans]SFS66028.1 citrate synthase [Marininema halotolerans]
MKKALGLEGIVATETELSHVDGQRGELIYHGYSADWLATNHSFEKVVYLLWNGHLPTQEEANQFRAAWVSNRSLSPFLHRLLEELPREMEMMDVLRTVVSAQAGGDKFWPPRWEQGLSLLAKIPAIIAYRYHFLKGNPYPKERSDLSHAAYFLYLLQGIEPNPAHVRALDAYFVLTVEHGLNASTFAARVVSSTRSDIFSCVTAAIGAMKGPLHGGAPSEVAGMLDEIHEPSQAGQWIRNRILAGEKLMGFGHRIYKTQDPRAQALRQVAKELAGKEERFQLALEVERVALDVLQELKPGRNLYTNVEYYASAVLGAVKLPRELYTPTFTASRIAGWCAHIFEQAKMDRIIRPQSEYIGPQLKNKNQSL